MRVARNRRYGGPAGIELVDLPIPPIGAGEIRIRVVCLSVNRTDTAFPRGLPRLIRLIYGVCRPRYPALGSEFSGVVDEVGGVVGFARRH